MRAHEPRIVTINSIDALSGFTRASHGFVKKYHSFLVQFFEPFLECCLGLCGLIKLFLLIVIFLNLIRAPKIAFKFCPIFNTSFQVV